MRIGLLLYGNLGMQSGGFMYDRMMAEHLEKQGDQLEVINLPWLPYGLGLGVNLSRALPRRLKDLCIDLLLQDELAHPSLFFLNRRLKAQLACPFIAIVHHLKCCEARPPWQNRLYRRIEEAYLRSVDGFIFNSEDTQKRVFSLTRAEKSALVAYPGGDRFSPEISEKDISARSFADTPFRVVFLANITPRKGLHTLVAGVSLLAETAWELLVVGSEEIDDSYVRSVKRQVRKAHLQTQVAFLGHLKDGEAAKVLAGSHLLAVPSSLEGFGIAYLEAMSFGLPVIASNAGGAKEIVDHGTNGFLVDPGDAAAVARCIRDLMNDRDRLNTMSVEALRTFFSRPSWTRTGEAVYSFLHNLG